MTRIKHDIIFNDAQIEILLGLLRKYYEGVEETLLSLDGQNMPPHQRMLLHLIGRVRLNAEGAVPLLKMFKNDFRLRVPLASAVRSILHDLIHVLYLATFIKGNKKIEQSFLNEIFMLQKDFLKLHKDVVEHEGKHFSHYPPAAKLFPKNEREQKQRIANVFSNNPEIAFKEKDEWKIKKPKAIRQSSLKQLFMIPNNFDKDLSIKSMYEHLEQSPEPIRSYSYAYWMYRYFSRYHHFTPTFEDFYTSNPSRDYIYLAITVEYMIAITDLVYKIVKVPELALSKNINLLKDLDLLKTLDQNDRLQA